VKSLNQLKWLRLTLQRAKWLYYTKLWKMDIDRTVMFSLSAKFDRTYPKGLHIGERTYVAFGAAILCHDRTRGLYLDTYIGRNCFIGAHSMVLPGVTIGDECVIGAGAIVTKDVPPRCAVAGNPARVIRENIEVGSYGRFKSADAPKPSSPATS
jgi:acetyltransferase-like isoleucine patch superfamily enzyme